jgi:hypothetical protein
MATNDKDSKSAPREGRQVTLKRLQRSKPRKLRVSAAEIIRASRGE